MDVSECFTQDTARGDCSAMTAVATCSLPSSAPSFGIWSRRFETASDTELLCGSGEASSDASSDHGETAMSLGFLISKMGLRIIAITVMHFRKVLG